MKERPILMSAPMVRAILAGAKTQTRRVVKDTGLYAIDAAIHGQETAARELLALATRCPYGVPGDRLWVRESLNYCSEYGHRYAADGTFLCSVFDDEKKQTGYSYECQMREGSVPSIHLPRRWSRILLEVTDVRVERLQDISEADAIAEGIERSGECNWRDYMDPHNDFTSARRSYRSLWAKLNGPGSWDANPWVWCVSFKRISSEGVTE